MVSSLVSWRPPSGAMTELIPIQVCGPCAKRADAGVSCSYGTGRQRRSGFSKEYVRNTSILELIG